MAYHVYLDLPVTLLHHHSDNPVLLVLVRDDVYILGIERVEDSRVIVPFVLLERCLFLVVLRNNIVAVPGLRSGADDEDIPIVEFRLHGIALHPQREVVLAIYMGIDQLDGIFLRDHLVCCCPSAKNQRVYKCLKRYLKR